MPPQNVTNSAADDNSSNNGCCDLDVNFNKVQATMDALLHTQHQGVFSQSIVTLLRMMKVDDLQKMVRDLLDTLTDKEFQQRMLRALAEHIKNHPYQTTFFVSGILLGIALMCNPLALAGFGALGPVAGSLAAGWQASMGGTIAAGSVFTVLQSWGMLYAVVIPVAGVAVTGATIVGAVAAPHIKNAVEDTWTVASACGKEVERWGKGEYGQPVKEWMEGKYGNPVAQWWKGDFGTPVSNWMGDVVQEKKRHEHND